MGCRSSPCPSESQRQANNLSRCPVLPTRRSPSKPNGFPPTGCPPLRPGAEALLTAHSIRIGDRTGNEVASPATSKLEGTHDDQDRNPNPPDAPRLCGQEVRRRQKPLDRDRRSLVAPGRQGLQREARFHPAQRR